MPVREDIVSRDPKMRVGQLALRNQLPLIRIDGLFTRQVGQAGNVGMQSLAIRTEVIEAVLNHMSGVRVGLVGTYQCYDFQQEKREVAEVARLLGISKRSLQRRLASAGTSFGAIVDAVRADLAWPICETPG